MNCNLKASGWLKKFGSLKKFGPKKSFDSSVKKTISLVLMTTVCTVSVFSIGTLSKKVNVDVDGEKLFTLTLNTDTGKILNQVGIHPTSDDEITREDIGNEININMKKAFDVYLVHGEDTKSVKMTGGTVGDALDKAGIVLEEGESVNFSVNESVKPDMHIEVFPLVMVNITINGEKKKYFVTSGSVIDALKYLNLDISSEDILNVGLQDEVYDGIDIVVNKVEYQEETVEEKIPFKVEYQKSDILNKRNQKIILKGKEGLRKVTYRKFLIDGKVIKCEEINSVIVRDPVNEIVVVGNDYQEEFAQSSPATSSVEKVVKKVLRGSATAYTAPKGAKTSTGSTPVENVTIAVDPRKIPYGSKLEITDGKQTWTGVAKDTGGALLNGSALVDIYMNNRNDCINFGRRQVEVRILK